MLPIDKNLTFLLVLLATWELVWKGMALWKASKNNQKNWFVALLLINSIGILPILYLKLFQKKHR
ncbi:MAG: hypothetical protein A2700_01795 [Candidatus Blackburnbacteria bacterium RIFCSPHIGHO2_01_FULL_44_64]|uniref:DUF5652 domain-containing protein n=1 Tax=Candidatus Blackburnbacteria bacterium RIFCSPHIGHO2_02_FULL_44_20 TaxID=1797516 RepID=A0A1G1V5C5_9BACT|nr:MAG: hypothetical protein A2700_01795 [Candidatus Blackburnbacteria bacterium RIFCSPHIGHO2_01_FULL_44_64]OGY10571.1 MAG: hypothetical protein A3D26_00225 [Candidatus Blackburnbacteria bacterium RIFCSPHIGHO2_02_FULL_44_20]OGY12282.1 MAG: hypothetical protein A3E16_01910 [Candidatus Blackburnbacteria bacterium RIFCSPHIGHO2_12_FULL_44_25]OGY14894.1 MAG: hypothetical protein A3A62_00715 [Candidatus Blackburnbacteria bacterium RIFCSPLOWO2_01_FULL_44_43]OGY17387.1 MAG: hypothetical protein A3H88_0